MDGPAQGGTPGLATIKQTLARRPRPGPDGGPTPARPWWVPPVRVDPATCGRGRVGGTTEPRGCVGGRPRRGGTAVLDETVSAGCPRHYPVVPNSDRRVTTDRAAPVIFGGHYATRSDAIWWPSTSNSGRPPSRTAELLSTQRRWSARGDGSGPPPVLTHSTGRSRQRRACARVGDGRQRDHGVRWFCRPGHLRRRGVRTDGWIARRSCWRGWQADCAASTRSARPLRRCPVSAT